MLFETWNMLKLAETWLVEMWNLLKYAIYNLKFVETSTFRFISCLKLMLKLEFFSFWNLKLKGFCFEIKEFHFYLKIEVLVLKLSIFILETWNTSNTWSSVPLNFESRLKLVWNLLSKLETHLKLPFPNLKLAFESLPFQTRKSLSNFEAWNLIETWHTKSNTLLFRWKGFQRYSVL